MKDDKVLRTELIALLDSSNAHMSFADAVADFPMGSINAKPANCPYSFWHLVEHIRITQWDILEFVLDPKHASPRWPEGYRPRPEAKTDEAGWRTSVDAVLADLERLKRLVTELSTDFLGPFPMLRAIRFSGKCCSRPTTTPTIPASSRSCARSRISGRAEGNT